FIFTKLISIAGSAGSLLKSFSINYTFYYLWRKINQKTVFIHYFFVSHISNSARNNYLCTTDE
ncbi:MAG: hypothetical protein K2K52_01800, partial [Paramuribaculum sp.]|nr:hypothetical protein [Paramuribaculum sp.]